MTPGSTLRQTPPIQTLEGDFHALIAGSAGFVLSVTRRQGDQQNRQYEDVVQAFHMPAYWCVSSTSATTRESTLPVGFTTYTALSGFSPASTASTFSVIRSRE